MFLKIVGGIAVGLILFLIYISTRDGHFRYERSGVINAPAEKIFPFISDLKRGGEWSPYEKKDPNMKKTFTGAGNEVGSKLDFDGNAEVGAGSLEITRLIPNEAVDIQLNMTKPMAAQNLVQYTLKPEGTGTRFTWALSGDGGFMGKLVGTLIDCEKMVAGDMNLGIENLKQLVESEK